MTDAAVPAAIEALEPFVGEWRMAADLALNPTDAPRASTTFEWLAGKRFLVQRWEVDFPGAPDGIAIIGIGPATGTYLQHYFDSRGVARLYDMAFAHGVWTLERSASEPDFSQRFTGHFSQDGDSIVGRWEIAKDGAGWSPDFTLTYRRVT
jgi:hypothetical protein